LDAPPELLDLWGEGWIRGNEHPVHPVQAPGSGVIQTPLLWLTAADEAWARVSVGHQFLLIADGPEGWHWVGDGLRFDEISVTGSQILASGAALETPVRLDLQSDQLGVVVVPGPNAPTGDAIVSLECGAACDGDPGPGTINLPDNQFHEAFVAAPAGGVFVGSMTDGAITRVDAQGTVHAFAAPREGWLQMGMLIDEPRGLLWACAVQATDLSGEVQSYRLSDGEVQHTFDLTDINGAATCNDLDLASNGHLYVSDRENPLMYRLQPDQNIGVLVATSELLNGLLGSNGVALTPDETAVIIGNYSPARLAVVYLDAPNEPIEMTFDGGAFRDGLTGGADGIFWHGDALYVSFPGKLMRVVPHGTDWTHSTLYEVTLAGGMSDVEPIGDTLYVGNGQPIAYVTGSTPDAFTVSPVPWAAWELD
jgi:sugar lactone lactonase YvrE